MIFRVTMKTPDALTDAMYRAVLQECNDIDIPDKEIREEKQYELLEKTRKFTDKFFSYGELVTLQIDTDKETITVI
jgi:hypothetical protein